MATTPTNIKPTHAPSSIPRDSDWKWANWLIDQLDEEDSSDSLVAEISVWQTAIKAVRKIEHERIYLSETPTDSDFKCHRICLTSLISTGESILLTMEDDCHGFRKKDIEAGVKALRHSYDEFHSLSTPGEDTVSSLKSKIFSGTP